MYELIKLSEHDYYMECPSRVGISKISDDEVIIFDSGNNKDAGKKVLRILDENGWKLKAIFNTHSHGDHTGGNYYLQSKTGCKAYGYEVCSAVLKYPTLHSAMFTNGEPIPKMERMPYSDCEVLTPDVLPDGYRFVPLLGHSPDQICYITPDNNAYVGDAIASKETLKKYAVNYLFSVGKYLDSLEVLRNLNAENYIPSHSPHIKDISDVVDFNIYTINSLCDLFESFCEIPSTFEEIVKKTFDHYGITMNEFQYFVIGSTISSYLSYLASKSRVEYSFEENKMIWKKI